MIPFLQGRTFQILGMLLAMGIAWAGLRQVYYMGYDRAEAVWQKRETAAVLQAMELERANYQRIMAAERAAAARAIAIADRLQKENRRAKEDLDRVNNCLRTGDCRMRFKAETRADPGGGFGVPSATADTRCGDGTQDRELPAETAIALRDLAGEADEVTRQLTAAQDTLRAVIQACTTRPSAGTPRG